MMSAAGPNRVFRCADPAQRFVPCGSSPAPPPPVSASSSGGPPDNPAAPRGRAGGVVVGQTARIPAENARVTRVASNSGFFSAARWYGRHRLRRSRLAMRYQPARRSLRGAARRSRPQPCPGRRLQPAASWALPSIEVATPYRVGQRERSAVPAGSGPTRLSRAAMATPASLVDRRHGDQDQLSQRSTAARHPAAAPK